MKMSQFAKNFSKTKGKRKQANNKSMAESKEFATLVKPTHTVITGPHSKQAKINSFRII